MIHLIMPVAAILLIVIAQWGFRRMPRAALRALLERLALLAGILLLSVNSALYNNPRELYQGYVIGIRVLGWLGVAVVISALFVSIRNYRHAISSPRDDWTPIGLEELERLVAEDLRVCGSDEQAVFEKHRVKPYPVPIVRFGNVASVLVIAKFGNRVLYYEDVEEGFELSELDGKGQILNHGCSQYSLQMVLHQVSKD